MTELVKHLEKEKFTMEKMLSCLLCDNTKLKKSILNLLQIILSVEYDGILNIIHDSRIQDIIADQIKDNLPDGNINLEEILCDPEYQILALLYNVQQTIVNIKQIYKADEHTPLKNG